MVILIPLLLYMWATQGWETLLGGLVVIVLGLCAMGSGKGVYHDGRQR